MKGRTRVSSSPQQYINMSYYNYKTVISSLGQVLSGSQAQSLGIVSVPKPWKLNSSLLSRVLSQTVFANVQGIVRVSSGGSAFRP